MWCIVCSEQTKHEQHLPLIIPRGITIITFVIDVMMTFCRHAYVVLTLKVQVPMEHSNPV